MKYCACWHCDDMIFWLLLPIPTGVYLHRTKIFCFHNQFTSSYNLSINCCVLLKFICPSFEHDNINPLVDVSVVFMAPYLPDSTNDDILSLIPSITTWCNESNVSEEVGFDENMIMFQLLKAPNTGQ